MTCCMCSNTDLLHVFKYSPLFYGMEVSLNSDGSLSWQYDLRKSIAGDICMCMETLFKIQVSDLAWTFFAYAHMCVHILRVCTHVSSRVYTHVHRRMLMCELLKRAVKINRFVICTDSMTLVMYPEVFVKGQKHDVSLVKPCNRDWSLRLLAKFQMLCILCAQADYQSSLKASKLQRQGLVMWLAKWRCLACRQMAVD